MTTPYITAVIAARGGSRRLPNKHLLPFNGSNLLVHKIKQLKMVQNIDRIVVTSDSDAILQCALNHGVHIHKRAPEYCDEKTKSCGEVVRHICENIEGVHVIFANCTSPLVTEKHFEQAIDIYFDNMPSEFDSLGTFQLFQRHLWDWLGPMNYKGMGKQVPSQELPPLYLATWGIAIAPRLKVIKWKCRHGHNPYRMILDKKASIDIDDALDMACAEAWLKM